MKILSNDEYENITGRIALLKKRVRELREDNKLYASGYWGWFERPDSISIKQAVKQIMKELDLEVEHQDAYTKIVKSKKDET